MIFLRKLPERKLRVVLLMLINTFCFCDGSIGTDSRRESSEEDTQLNEALLLVQMLKTEYIKALRANVVNQINELVATTPAEELSTCASTTAGPNAAESSNGLSTTGSNAPDTSNSYVTLATTTSDPPPATQAQITSPVPTPPHQIPPRRRGYNFVQDTKPASDYHKLDIPWRRFSKEFYNPSYGKEYRRFGSVGDIILDGPTKNITNIPISQRNTNDHNHKAEQRKNLESLPHSRYIAEKDIKSNKGHDIIKSSLQRLLTNYEMTGTTSSTGSTTTGAPITKDYVRGQVLAELALEMQRRGKGQQPAILKRMFRKQMLPKKTRRSKSTLKIHMAKSTPMSVPLSENNAFCFFEPNSILCKTP